MSSVPPSVDHRASGAGRVARVWRNSVIASALLLAALAALLLGASRATLRQQIAVGAGDERALAGFYEPESNALGGFRWSRPGATLFIYGADGRQTLVQLRLNAARPDASAAALTLESGVFRGSIAVGSTWRRYTLLVPTRRTDDTALVFGGDALRPPGDNRDLGVTLSDITISPLGGPLGGVPPERAIFLLSIAPLIWLGALALGLVPRAALALGVASLAIVFLAAASPLESGYWLPTFGWPWWPALGLIVLAAWPQIDAWRAGAGGWVQLRIAVPTPGVGRWELAALLGLTLLALVLRLVSLDTLPLGLWRDEARHGLIALEILRDPTYRPVYVVQGADLPALLFYLDALAIGAIGPGVASVRLVSALAGALTPLALWWAGRPLLGRGGALAGAALLAWAAWSLSMSRWGFPATLDQLLTLLAVGLALRGLGGWQGRAWARGALLGLAGAIAALAAYAYHTGRLTPLLLTALVVCLLGRDRLAWRRAASGLALALLLGLLVLAPLLRFIADDFAGYNRRTSAVAFSTIQDAGVHAPLLLLLQNARSYALMWHVAGDRNGRHHLPGAPMVDAVTGALLLGGLALAARRRGTPLTLLTLWLTLGLVPALLSAGAPHAMRSLPALAPACLLAGGALAALLRELQRRGSRRLAVLGGGALLAASCALNGWQYAVQMPRDPAVQEAFDVPETMMGRLLAAQRADPGQVTVCIPAGARANEVVRFLGAGAPVALFDPDRGCSGPAASSTLLAISAGADEALVARARAALGPGVVELDPPRYPDGRPIVRLFGVGDAAARLARQTFAAK